MANIFSVYIHIPFCASKCDYCDFYSIGGKREVPDEYISALLREIKIHDIKNASTIYLGGGTPSLLSAKQAHLLISACTPMHDAEITIEANPDSIALEAMMEFKVAGVNRVSIGVQTALDASLKRLGRTHTSRDASWALQIVAKAGFVNISGDIMLSLPYYTLEEFEQTLGLLKNGGVTHISSYILKIEERTQFGKRPPEGLPSEDESADFYLYSVRRLEQEGYGQYEISNFAQTGYESRHNLAYWDCEDYIGIGAAAHSCMSNKRFYYAPSVQGFIDNATIVADGECTQQDYIMLQLRLARGLQLSKLKERYGAELTEQQMKFLHKCQDEKYVSMTNDYVKLTPSGLLLQNSILAQLV